MKSVIVIGGGLAGISSAINLLERNYNIKLIESSPYLGGRAKSYFEKDLNLWFDNGQHLLITGYKDTLDIIHKIDANKNFIIQDKFKVKFRDKSLKEWELTFSNSIGDLIKLFGFKNLNLSEKLNFFFFLQRIKDYNEKLFENRSVLELLKSNRQSEKIIENFWRLFVESTMNSPIEKASASVLIFVLKKMFFENYKNSSLIIPEKSFLESFIIPVEKFLTSKNVEIIKNRSVSKLEIQSDKIISVIDNKRERHFADYFILAVPYHIYVRLLIRSNIELNFQSILNAHLIFENYQDETKFYALWNSPVHWVFFHKSHITLIRSNSDEFLSLNERELKDLFISEFLDFFPEYKNKKIFYFKIVKEKRATFISDFSSIRNRVKTKTEFSNLFIAGDFVDTGYPSTIESAVKSGKMTAEEILKSDYHYIKS